MKQSMDPKCKMESDIPAKLMRYNPTLDLHYNSCPYKFQPRSSSWKKRPGNK
jgi:hypothetical protein